MVAPYYKSCTQGSYLLCSSLIRLFTTTIEYIRLTYFGSSVQIVCTDSQITKFPQKMKIDNFEVKLTQLFRPDIHALFTAKYDTGENYLILDTGCRRGSNTIRLGHGFKWTWSPVAIELRRVPVHPNNRSSCEKNICSSACCYYISQPHNFSYS